MCVTPGLPDYPFWALKLRAHNTVSVTRFGFYAFQRLLRFLTHSETRSPIVQSVPELAM